MITADGGFRRGMIVQLKKNVDEALKLTDDQGRLLGRSVEKVIASGSEIKGDTTTLEDLSVLARLSQSEE